MLINLIYFIFYVSHLNFPARDVTSLGSSLWVFSKRVLALSFLVHQLMFIVTLSYLCMSIVYALNATTTNNKIIQSCQHTVYFQIYVQYITHLLKKSENYIILITQYRNIHTYIFKVIGLKF